MILHEYRNDVRNKVRDRCVRQFLILVFVASVFCSGAGAELVPFVIPAKPAAGSLIAVSSFEPVTTGSDRLETHGGHFQRNGKRVRLWGVNLSFGANFPTHEDAPFIAARLAAAGVNTVRCHHMDTANWPRGIWNAKDGATIAPEALDRLDFFIDQLARRGIFVNINLHVGRAHSKYLGLPEPNRKYDKISNIFTPALIEAQKRYARELLGHVNKYRKVRYADDPAVAIVEITNENSFLMWSSEQTLRTLPPYYADILRGKFNVWLKGRYGSNEKLRIAWAEGIQPLGGDLLTNGNFKRTLQGTNVPSDWRLEQHSGCKASVSRQRYESQNAVQIRIDKSDDTEWHLQFTQGGFSVKAGQYYTVIFSAAGDKARRIGCSVSQAHSPWSNLGLSRQVDLTPEWQQFRFGFAAGADDEDARISFSFGGSEIPVYLANVEFRPGGRVGLREDESLETSAVALYADTESPARSLDRMKFLAETEKQYFDGMRSFIRNDLRCGALVTGTIVFGPLGLYTQSDMDFIDAHAYWQHPRFPGRPWDSGNWLVDQKPMVDHPEQATLFRLASQRLEGKPYTVSEYNHPAPLDSQAECVPMIASFGAAQDWDGIWLYTYSHGTDDWYRENLSGYFDIDTNPAKWGFMRSGAILFRDGAAGLLQGGHVVALSEPRSDRLHNLVRLHLRYDRDMLGLVRHCDSYLQKLYEHQNLATYQIRTTLQDSHSGFEVQPMTSAHISWTTTKVGGLYTVRSYRSQVYVGHARRFKDGSKNKVSIERPEFAALTIVPLDGNILKRSRQILVTACGRCENTGMRFSEDRRTVGRNWGGPPVRIETVTGTLALPEGQWCCEALGPDGMPKRVVPVSGGVLKLSPEYGTMWYLLTRTARD